MSSFQLKVHFHGLCAFSPDPNGRHMWVFLREARQGSKKVPAHAPVVRFRLENLVKDSPGDGLWMLDRLDLRISPTDGKGLTVSCFDLAQNRCPNPAQKQADCFSWIAPLEEACIARGFPNGGKVDGAFRDNPPLDVNIASKLGARILLVDGHLGTETFSAFDNRLIESRFRPFEEGTAGQNDHIQFTAAVVQYTATVPSGAVTISATRLQSGKHARSLILTPVKPGADVEIDVMNEEAERLVGLKGNTQAPTKGTPRDQDRIFEKIFDLCSAPPPAKERPMPVPEQFVAQAKANLPILDGSPPCDPIRTGI